MKKEELLGSKIDQLQSVLTKEMSRKEFLQHVGVFAIGAVGISGLLNHFLSISGPQSQNSTTQQSGGYGSQPYGR